MHTQWESLANSHILGIAPYEPGKPIEELEREIGIHDAIKLASNENPLAPSERVQQAIAAAVGNLNRYPDGSGFYLRQAIAKKHDFAQDQVIRLQDLRDVRTQLTRLRIDDLVLLLDADRERRRFHERSFPALSDGPPRRWPGSSRRPR